MSEVTQSCPILCHPMDCRPPGSSVHGDSTGKNTGVGRHFLLQGIFPTQGSNPGLQHCRQTLYPLSHQGSPRANIAEETVSKSVSHITLKNCWPIATVVDLSVIMSSLGSSSHPEFATLTPISPSHFSRAISLSI